jgi:7-carboxy-7-deazaguanine synthase (Cx14CxxC type)
MYSVKELFYTLQGEGANAGRPAVFCRFTGCNLWTGREEGRSQAVCRFCDTDFIGTNGIGGGKFQTATELAVAVATTWPFPPSGCATPPDRIREQPFVVCTGGEPLLQLDEPLIDALHAYGFAIAVETNGTQPLPSGVDWVCVSPKAGTDLVVRTGNELKLVYPQPEAEPERFIDYDFQYFFLQPMDGPEREGNTRQAISYCLTHPQWRLSLQTHKLLGIP